MDPRMATMMHVKMLVMRSDVMGAFLSRALWPFRWPQFGDIEPTAAGTPVPSRSASASPVSAMEQITLKTHWPRPCRAETWPICRSNVCAAPAVRCNLVRSLSRQQLLLVRMTVSTCYVASLSSRPSEQTH